MPTSKTFHCPQTGGLHVSCMNNKSIRLCCRQMGSHTLLFKRYNVEQEQAEAIWYWKLNVMHVIIVIPSYIPFAEWCTKIKFVPNMNFKDCWNVTSVLAKLKFCLSQSQLRVFIIPFWKLNHKLYQNSDCTSPCDMSWRVYFISPKE